MLTFVMENIENYARAHTKNESLILHEIFNEAFSKTKYPDMSVGHVTGAFLRLLVQITGAKKILEIGTYAGYSALAMAEGMRSNGGVITLDKDPKITDIARIYWNNSPHGKKIRLVLGDARETLKKIDGFFDIVFIDADKISYPFYWEECVPKVRTGGLIITDNVLWKGRVLNPKDEESLAIDSFNKIVLSDNRVEAVMLTVRDGLMLAYKK